MTRRVIRGWFLVHRWTSLVCTAFLLMLCLTGLPLIFHDEIDRATGHAPVLTGPASSAQAPGLLPLDAMLARALRERPGEVPLFMAFDNVGPLTTVTTGPRADAPANEMTLHLLDRTTGNVVGPQGATGGVVAFLLQLHTDLFLGLAGMFLLGGMGVLFVAALISGAVLYAPFMRKLRFGTLRTTRSRRLRWLDFHNLLGVAALGWMSVVSITGVVNAFVDPITKAWTASDLSAMTRAYRGRPLLSPARYGSLDRAMAAARRAVPGARPQFIGFPGGAFSSGQHYAVFFQGGTALTERLLTVTLVDAGTGIVTDTRPMPWYFRALSLSRPLHFGDYGGLPLKLIWAALDLLAIVVLGSGLYLSAGRRHQPGDVTVREMALGAAVPA